MRVGTEGCGRIGSDRVLNGLGVALTDGRWRSERRVSVEVRGVRSTGATGHAVMAERDSTELFPEPAAVFLGARTGSEEGREGVTGFERGVRTSRGSGRGAGDTRGIESMGLRRVASGRVGLSNAGRVGDSTRGLVTPLLPKAGDEPRLIVTGSLRAAGTVRAKVAGSGR